MPSYDDTLSVGQARTNYFAANHFGDGGYENDYIESKVGPFKLRLATNEIRGKGLRIHDLHHIATGYSTTLLGEAEVSAWELGSGGAGLYSAVGWYLYLGVLGGLLINPLAVRRAYKRGKSCKNLYTSAFDESMLAWTVGELRAKLGLTAIAREGERRICPFATHCIATAPCEVGDATNPRLRSSDCRGIARAD